MSSIIFLCTGGGSEARAAAQLIVEPITWDVIGLDSNSVNTGPAEYPVGARVRNVGNMPATNVKVQFNWLTNNQYINLTSTTLGTTDTLTSPSIGPGASGLFYFNATVTRTPAAHLTARRFQISAMADTISPATGPVRELYVEKILSQSRNDVLSFTGPDSVEVGQTYQFNLKAKTATNGYEQLQVFINFPNSIFRIISINARYSAPRPGYTNTIDYADACGWDSNPNSPTYRSCIGPCLTSSCKAGGNIDTIYTVQVIRNIETTLSLTTLIHDFSGSSYHYNSDFGVTKTIIPTTDLTIVKTAIPDLVEAGTTFSYQITAQNVGGRDAENVMVTDTLPDGINFISSNPPPIAMNGTNPQVWGLGTLPAGQDRTILLVAEALCSAIPTGSRSVTKMNTAIIQTSTQETNSNNNTATETVTIQDTIPPTITCPAEQSVNNDPGFCSASVNVGTPATNDNCGTATLTGVRSDGQALNASYPVGMTTITWTVTDVHTNTASCTQKITVSDTEDPTITCPADQTVSNDPGLCSASVNVGTPATNDNCGTATLVGLRSDSLALNAAYPVGMTTITWTVTDIHGNTASCTQKITVNDTEDPAITCPADQTVDNDPGLCSADVNVGTPATNDNCGTATLVGVRSDGQALTASYPVGMTTITWTVTDIHGNSNSCTQKITVNDTEDPAITCPADVTTNTETGLCTARATVGTPVTSDNCATATLTATRSDGLPLSDPFPVGMTTITWTVTDIHGNASSCSQKVTITDQMNPQITCPADICVNAVRGQCEAEVDPGAPTASDNCSTVTVTGTRDDNQPLNAPYPVGVTTITWKATDASGNMSTCTQTVTYGVLACPSVSVTSTK